jgi:Arc/MetJ family transcription regulator
MPTEKVSLTLDEELLSEARDAVGSRGLSRYVNRALRHQLQHDRLGTLLEELEREHGPIDPQVMEEVRRRWPAPEKKSA